MDADRCVMCGEIIPEGRQVCPNCEARIMEHPLDEMREAYAEEKQISKKPKQYTDSFKITYYFCPVCEYVRVRSKQKRCETCGQLLDWEVEND